MVSVFLLGIQCQASATDTVKDEIKKSTFEINEYAMYGKSNNSKKTGKKKNTSKNKKKKKSKKSSKNKKSDKSYSKKELRLMTSIIFCEARGECYAGQKAVGIVVMNRVKSKEFPNSIKKVIYQSGQFTPVRNGSLSKALTLYDKYKKKGKFKGEMKSCYKAAKEVLAGSTTIKVKGSRKQMNKYLFFSQYIPGAKYTLGCHQFK